MQYLLPNETTVIKKTHLWRNVCVCVQVGMQIYIFYILCVVLPYTQMRFLLHACLWKPVKKDNCETKFKIRNEVTV